MHPLLVHFNVMSSFDPIVGSEAKAIQFLTEMELIPSRNLLMFCPLCGCEAPASADCTKKVGFRFICRNKRRTKCKGTIQPLKNTFFEGTRIPFRDILVIIICFVYGFPESEVWEDITAWRRQRGEDLTIHYQTVVQYYKFCKDIQASVKSQTPEGSVKGTTSGRKSKGEKIYDFLIAMRKIYPGPAKVGIEIKSLELQESINWDKMELSNSA